MGYYDQYNRSAEKVWDRPRSGFDLSRGATTGTFMNQVYQHMAMGLGLTGIVALMASRSPEALQMVQGSWWILALVQIGAVVALSGWAEKMNAGVATALFYGYAALTGLTLSFLFLIYTHESLATTFFVTGGTFGAMSAYGYVTKRDLTRMGSLLFMALIGLVIASLVNLVVHSTALMWITSFVGVLLFVGLTAYDTQRLKHMAAYAEDSGSMYSLSIRGALVLYLDFINLFLYLIRFMGRRRD